MGDGIFKLIAVLLFLASVLYFATELLQVGAAL